jgi:hypothetical protein
MARATRLIIRIKAIELHRRLHFQSLAIHPGADDDARSFESSSMRSQFCRRSQSTLAFRDRLRRRNSAARSIGGNEPKGVVKAMGDAQAAGQTAGRSEHSKIEFIFFNPLQHLRAAKTGHGGHITSGSFRTLA